MKQHSIYYLLCIIIMLLTAGCTVRESKNANESENTQEDLHKKYESYMQLIDNYMSDFQGKYTNTFVMENSEITILTGTVDIASTEGNHALKYLDTDGNVVRYNIDIFGETGQRNVNYYVIDEDQLFITELVTTYSCPNLSFGGYDILKYDIKKFMLDGNDLYCMDDVEQTIVLEEDKDELLFQSLEALEKSFVEEVEESND